jgi:carbon starvation protein CstA
LGKAEYTGETRPMTDKETLLTRRNKNILFVILLIVLIIIVMLVRNLLGEEYAIYLTIFLVILHIVFIGVALYKYYNRKKNDA